MVIPARNVFSCPQKCPQFSSLPYRLGHSLFCLGAQAPWRISAPLSTHKAHGEVEFFLPILTK